jgi:hypothetical protein
MKPRENNLINHVHADAIFEVCALQAVRRRRVGRTKNDDANAELLVKMKILHSEEERQSWDYRGETGFVILGVRS